MLSTRDAPNEGDFHSALTEEAEVVKASDEGRSNGRPRYDKLARSFLAAIALALARIWNTYL
jgi:hypothetical protein